MQGGVCMIYTLPAWLSRLLKFGSCAAVMLQPVWRTIGPVVGPGSLIARDLLMNLITWTAIGLAFLWACFKILVDVLPLILIRAGKHEQLAKLQVGTSVVIAIMCSWLRVP